MNGSGRYQRASREPGFRPGVMLAAFLAVVVPCLGTWYGWRMIGGDGPGQRVAGGEAPGERATPKLPTPLETFDAAARLAPPGTIAMGSVTDVRGLLGRMIGDLPLEHLSRQKRRDYEQFMMRTREIRRIDFYAAARGGKQDDWGFVAIHSPFTLTQLSEAWGYRPLDLESHAVAPGVHVWNQGGEGGKTTVFAVEGAQVDEIADDVVIFGFQDFAEEPDLGQLGQGDVTHLRPLVAEAPASSCLWVVTGESEIMISPFLSMLVERGARGDHTVSLEELPDAPVAEMLATKSYSHWVRSDTWRFGVRMRLFDDESAVKVRRFVKGIWAGGKDQLEEMGAAPAGLIDEVGLSISVEDAEVRVKGMLPQGLLSRLLVWISKARAETQERLEQAQRR